MSPPPPHNFINIINKNLIVIEMDFENFKKYLDEWVESDMGNKYFENARKTDEIRNGRYIKFEEWLKHNDFDKLIYRLILEHDENWRENCWHKGFEVYPNNKLQFIFDYIDNNFESISVPQIESKNFSSQCWFFKGYYFKITHGQGCVNDIYNGGDFKHLISI